LDILSVPEINIFCAGANYQEMWLKIIPYTKVSTKITWNNNLNQGGPPDI
jgi:hypothetical protein